MTTIRTPHGVAADLADPPPVEAQLRGLCADMDLLECDQSTLAGDVQLLEGEISRLICECDRLRRRIAALERRPPRRPRVRP